MNEAMHRFDRKMDCQRLLMRAGTVLLVVLFGAIVLILMDAGIQDARFDG